MSSNSSLSQGQTRSQSKHWKIAPILGALFLCLFLPSTYYVTCRYFVVCGFIVRHQAEEREIPTWALLPGDDQFPESWTATRIETSSNPGFGAADAAYRNLAKSESSATDDITTGYIHVARYDWVPTYQFRWISRYYEFAESDGWILPPEFDFEPEYADQWRTGCSHTIHGLNVYRCKYFARYAEYLVRIDIDIASPDTPDNLQVSWAEVGQILQAQDRWIGAQLHR